MGECSNWLEIAPTDEGQKIWNKGLDAWLRSLFEVQTKPLCHLRCCAVPAGVGNSKT